MVKYFWELTKDFSYARTEKIEENKEKIRAHLNELALNRIEQILGKALGYPYLDHTVCSKCHPVKGCTCGDPQVCIGEHTAETLAMEAANVLRNI